MKFVSLIDITVPGIHTKSGWTFETKRLLPWTLLFVDIMNESKLSIITRGENTQWNVKSSNGTLIHESQSFYVNENVLLTNL